jgi:hypothetical protein
MNDLMAAITATKLDDITRTRGAGRPVNTHVMPSHSIKEPDFEQMKKLVHDTESPKAPEPHKSEK